MNMESRYLVTITENSGEVYDEFVITNPDGLIDLIGFPIVGLVVEGEMDHGN
jgi:hypothetical protein